MAAAPTRLTCPLGEFELKRYPARKHEQLQAWCSADLLLLEAIETTAETLVVNDEHGVLATALAPCTSWTDSAMAVLAAKHNCQRNQVPAPNIVWSTASPANSFRQVLIRIPKHLPYFEYQLAALANTLPAGATLMCAGMDKHLSPQTATLIERYFDEVHRHRGQRKARLFTGKAKGRANWNPDEWQRGYYCEQLGGELRAGPNVFSGDKLDIGSRFLLEQLAGIATAGSTVDLACGNGVLGIAALQQGLATDVLFVDESAMAIAAAQENCRSLAPAAGARFHHGDGLEDIDDNFELILCNPPFHLGHTVDDYAGRRLIQQAAQHLLPGGRLVLVANRHLEYAPLLNRAFKQVKRLAQNNKFIVWQAHLS